MDADRARTLLEAEARRLDSLAHGAAGHFGGELLDAPEAEADAVAAGADLLDREVEMALAVGLDADRRAVADALARLEAGTYGMCDRCAQPIGAERLEAVPATRFCVDHEQWAETMLEAAGVDGSEMGRDPLEVVRSEAQSHLEFLADDDAPQDPLAELASEERAVHLRSQE